MKAYGDLICKMLVNPSFLLWWTSSATGNSFYKPVVCLPSFSVVTEASLSSWAFCSSMASMLRDISWENKQTNKQTNKQRTYQLDLAVKCSFSLSWMQWRSFNNNKILVSETKVMRAARQEKRDFCRHHKFSQSHENRSPGLSWTCFGESGSPFWS